MTIRNAYEVKICDDGNRIEYMIFMEHSCSTLP